MPFKPPDALWTRESSLVSLQTLTHPLGGGTALLYASQTLSQLTADNFDQQQGIDIVQRALQVPCKTIASNAGIEGSVIVERLLERNDRTMGYDAYNDQIVNMVDQGIIDPTKVVRTALVDAASISSLMITTEASIVSLPDAEGANAMAAAAAGGMGGMGGMM